MLYLLVKFMGVPGAERQVGASYLSAIRELTGESVGCVVGNLPDCKRAGVQDTLLERSV